ncbi:MAG: GNAT family N-acetyltransferase [Deltaproteobacteria bacterium]|nr:GNAT family N-acetyltransferase [Deltaproteobacteria bacterium]
MATLETRRALITDATSVSRLCLLLGYDCTEALMRQRIAKLRDDPNHAIFVAAIDGAEVVGWVHVETRMPLTGKPFADIVALVVSATHRRLGIGRALAERVVAWAQIQQLSTIHARAQEHREDALTFYEGLGYALYKEHQVYRRVLDGPDDTGGTPTIVD